MNGVKSFMIGMFIMLVIIKPQVLAGIAQGINIAFSQPTNPSYQRGAIVFEDSLSSNEQPLDPIQMRLLERIGELEGKLNQPLPNTDVVASTNVSPTQAQHSPAKVAAFQKALQEQEVLERFVKYSGNDPVVRSRMGLPPVRITTIEEFDFEGDDTISVSKFEQLFNARFKK